MSRRFVALEAAAAGGPLDRGALGLGARDRALARRVLRTLEARWHDGDENLVRGMLDRWVPIGAPPVRERAQRLVEGARELARVEARDEAWWFFLWEMESVLALVGDEGR